MRSRAKKTRKQSIQPWIAGGLTLAVAAGLAAAILWRAAGVDKPSPESAGSQGSRQPPPAPADWLLPDDLPPLPPPTQPLPRPALVVRAAYESAARQPEVLGRIPCFCGCAKLGHRSNHDCFVATRAATGQVTWDAHGMG